MREASTATSMRHWLVLLCAAAGVSALVGWTVGVGRWPTYADVFDAAAPGVVNVRIGEPPRRVGTGFALSASVVVTARHLVVDAQSPIIVLNQEGRSFEATVVGTDARSDLALLEVSDGALMPLPLGSSESLRVGDTLVAIGNPYGLGHSLSAGVLAQRGRRPDPAEPQAPRVDFLQLSMGLSPGNSGGPVLDESGLVVGVLAGTHAQGAAIAFAVPVEALQRSLPRLRAGANVSRAWLGVRVDESGGDTKVTAVVPSSPADRAGLRVGDRLQRLADVWLDEPGSLQHALDRLEGGARAELVFVRDGQVESKTVPLADWADQPVVAAGITLSPEPGAGGRVVAIRPRSRAEMADVRVGDLVLAVDGVPVRAPADVKHALTGGQWTELDLHREGRAITARLEPQPQSP